jgi:outer membrane protein assembly factor BamA
MKRASLAGAAVIGALLTVLAGADGLAQEVTPSFASGNAVELAPAPPPKSEDKALNGPTKTDTKPDAKPVEGAAKRLPKPAFVGVPIPESSPAIGSGVTVVAAALYEPSGAGNVWTSGVGGIYTSTKSYGFGALQKAYFDHDRYRLTLGAGYGDFNLRFYGVGSLTSQDKYITINQSGALAAVEGLVRVAPHTYVGPVYAFLDLKTTLPSAMVANITIPAYQLKSTDAGLGLTGEYDSRDSQYGPSRGIFATARWMFSEPAFGSRFQYDRATVWVNGYFTLTPTTILATRISGCYASEGAPFYNICLYGQNNDLRGYLTGQYRDPLMATGQAEIRQHLFWKIGMVAFGGVGGIAPGPNSLQSRLGLGSAIFLPAGGVGLRFMVAPQYKLNLAVDEAWGSHSNGLYINIGEAF